MIEQSSNRAPSGTFPGVRRRVLFITYDFPPSARVGAFSCEQIARYLPLHGWDPIVLSARESNYESSLPQSQPTYFVTRTRVLPHPLIVYQQMKNRLLRRKDLPNAAAATYRAKRGAFGGARELILDLLSIPDRYTGWLPPAIMAGLDSCRRSQVSAIFSSGPWWTNHLVALALAPMTGLPWLAHFRDPWTHAPNWKAKGGVAQHLQAALEKLVVTRATAVVCVTHQHANLLKSLYPTLPQNKFISSPNGYDEVEWSNEAPGNGSVPTAFPSRFTVTYAGSLYEERSPAPIFRAIRQLIDNGEIDADTLQFDFIGWCDTAEGQALRNIATEWNLARHVHLHGALARAETHRRMTESSLLLLLAENRTLLIPAKAYEYLRAGRPILALAPEKGAVADLFARTGGAWVVDQANDAAITAALRDAYRGWQNGYPARLPDQTVVATYDRVHLTGQLAQVLEKIVTSSSLSPNSGLMSV